MQLLNSYKYQHLNFLSEEVNASSDHSMLSTIPSYLFTELRKQSNDERKHHFPGSTAKLGVLNKQVTS